MSAATTSLPKSKVTRENAYKCPEDFACFTHKPCSSTLTSSLTRGNTELWLIKVPASFNPQRFNGLSVPLSGLQTLRVAAADDDAAASAGGGSSSSGPQRLYSVLGSGRHRPPADLHLLTAAGPASDRVVCGPAFCGVLNVGEVYGDLGDDALRRPLRAIPAAPAPAAPPGLKQRFLPFGSKTPTLTFVADSELEAVAAGPSSATLRPLVVKHFPAEEEEMMGDMTEEEQRRERKRRRKLNRIKTERRDPGLAEQEVQEVQEVQEEDLATAVALVKVEPVGMPFDHQEEEEERRRKRKKRKKDKEGGQALEAKEEAPMVEEVVVKCEPVDVAYEEQEAGSAKKKKKKRRSKMEDACA